MVMRKTAQAPVSGLELFFYSIESGTRNLHLPFDGTDGCKAGSAKVNRIAGVMITSDPVLSVDPDIILKAAIIL